MGTRALTRVFTDDNKEIICLYRQMDGYPDVHGEELAQFLAARQMVNGFNGEPPAAGKTKSNGMDHLAVQLVAHFASDRGGFYLYPPGSKDVGEAYVYEVRAGSLKCLSVWQNNKCLYDGKPELFSVDESEDDG